MLLDIESSEFQTITSVRETIISLREVTMIPDGNPSRPGEEFVAAAIQFVGDQDGPPERELKGHLASLFKNERSVHRAYLARVRYNNAEQYDVALCLSATNPDVAGLNERVGCLFAKFFHRDAFLDILFLSPGQEAEIDKVCSAFYEGPHAGVPLLPRQC